MILIPWIHFCQCRSSLNLKIFLRGFAQGWSNCQNLGGLSKLAFLLSQLGSDGPNTYFLVNALVNHTIQNKNNFKPYHKNFPCLCKVLTFMLVYTVVNSDFFFFFNFISIISLKWRPILYLFGCFYLKHNFFKIIIQFCIHKKLFIFIT